MWILSHGGTAEYVEKRSRFIATLIPVTSESEAQEQIGILKKKYYDARHNCYAYIVFSDNKKEVIERSSDDGEPSGTAGRPMLDILSGNEIRNILVVVTRYFGGTLLGSGGLVRAYSTAVKDALDNSDLTAISDGIKIQINLDYTNLGSVQYLMRECDVSEVSSDFGDAVSMSVVVPSARYDRFKEELTQIFSGKQVFSEEEPVRYGRTDSGVFIL
ncbi:MAG: YigZ family protein [Eubacterium sp.]|nr:YigZ family protein [Eubacterium sp.]